MTELRRLSNDEIARVNRGLLWLALDSVYDTHITDQPTSTLRGEAIQALGRLAEALGYPNAVNDAEAVPISVRREQSAAWAGTHLSDVRAAFERGEW